MFCKYIPFLKKYFLFIARFFKGAFGFAYPSWASQTLLAQASQFG
jgi:hypothetical protein